MPPAAALLAPLALLLPLLALCLTPNQKTPLGTLGIPPLSSPPFCLTLPNIKQQERQTDLHNKGLKCFDVTKRAVFVFVYFFFLFKVSFIAGVTGPS